MPTSDVWVAVARCGCVNAAAMDGMQGLDKIKLDWLKSGRSVLWVSNADFEATYRQRLLARCAVCEPGERD